MNDVKQAALRQRLRHYVESRGADDLLTREDLVDAALAWSEHGLYRDLWTGYGKREYGARRNLNQILDGTRDTQLKFIDFWNAFLDDAREPSTIEAAVSSVLDAELAKLRAAVLAAVASQAGLHTEQA